jgi:hypothetical protein
MIPQFAEKVKCMRIENQQEKSSLRRICNLFGDCLTPDGLDAKQKKIRWPIRAAPVAQKKRTTTATAKKYAKVRSSICAPFILM